MSIAAYKIKGLMIIIMIGVTLLHADSNVSSASSELTAKEKEVKKAKWLKTIDEMTSAQREKFKDDMHQKELEKHKQWVNEYKTNTKAQESQKRLGSDNKFSNIGHIDHGKNRQLAKNISSEKVKKGTTP